MVERVIISSGAKGYFFTITNAQGDVIGIRNSTGAVIARYNYDAFGKLISTTDDSGNILTGNSFATQINVRYRGYYYDSETGLYYLQSRYYDPETGRFLNADDVNFLGATKTLLSYNAFAYCENDVVNMQDYIGLIPYGIGIGIPKEIDNKIPKCNGKYIAIKKSTKYKDVALYLSVRMFQGNRMSYSYSGYRIMQKGTALYLNYTLSANSYFMNRKIDVYKFMTFSKWMMYLDYENRNIITRFKNKFIKRFFKTQRQYEIFMDDLSNVFLPAITEHISPTPQFISLCIDLAEELLNYYNKYLSKELKYLRNVLSTVKKEHKSDSYNIYIPYLIYYDKEVMKSYGSKYIRGWQRQNTVYLYR